ncbi:hypothetical protein [Streptomyces halobius]|uniref:Peptidase inhibitor family I36 n=1 Tax=Streptomyces halobius TaxID=2879846 RepID=A0ABY4M0U5_9ACTN|nr:hypothetical protein [Streptomyces halobius]UQA91389.1 hypothetical protein K9S39_05390 [Streptomyces halobius]
MRRAILTRTLTVAGTLAVSGIAAAPSAQAAASACSHDWSGPQICITTDGDSGSENPGHVTTAWTNPPKSRKTATVYITQPDGFTYKIKAKRSGGQIIGHTVPGAQRNGKLCARYKGSSHTACVEIIDRN